jgi:hypothetical protein
VALQHLVKAHTLKVRGLKPLALDLMPKVTVQELKDAELTLKVGVHMQPVITPMQRAVVQ